MRGRLAGFAGGMAVLAVLWWALSLLVPAGFVPGPGVVVTRFLVLFPGALAAHAWVEIGKDKIVGGVEADGFTRLAAFGGAS